MKAFSTIKLPTVYQQPNGDISVCIDWQPYSTETRSGILEGFICHRIDLSPGQLSTDKVIELFVRDKYSQSEEFALINAYNASVSGIDPNPEKEQEYVDFLNWRKQMKNVVKEAVLAYIAAHPFVEPEMTE